MNKLTRWFIIGTSLLLLVACQGSPKPVGTGFRYSSYGPPFNPGEAYWASVASGMATRFPGSVPQGIWILGTINGQGLFIGFPTGIDSPYVYDLPVDSNEATLNYFDDAGVQVWLQIEPGMAPVEDLIHAMMEQYHHHPSVIGVGVDVEWYKSYQTPEGQAVTDEVARSWVQAARAFGKQYRCFLKHWEIEKMPPNYRDGLVFIDDSQGFESLEELTAAFQAWGEAFYPDPVGFQFGYRRDKAWWEQMGDPPGEIGRAILEVAPNAEGLYWVDFTVFDVFPPK